MVTGGWYPLIRTFYLYAQNSLETGIIQSLNEGLIRQLSFARTLLLLSHPSSIGKSDYGLVDGQGRKKSSKYLILEKRTSVLSVIDCTRWQKLLLPVRLINNFNLFKSAREFSPHSLPYFVINLISEYIMLLF